MVKCLVTKVKLTYFLTDHRGILFKKIFSVVEFWVLDALASKLNSSPVLRTFQIHFFKTKTLRKSSQNLAKMAVDEMSGLKQEHFFLVVKAMESAMKQMNLEKVQDLMDRFEKDFENLGSYFFFFCIFKDLFF